MSEGNGQRRAPKHERIFQELHSAIQSGQYGPGDRLPNETELGRMFKASRFSVSKALLHLQELNLITRRPGAGTTVLAQSRGTTRSYGLLIPELGTTEIFEPICQGMMRSSLSQRDVLLWGSLSSSIENSAAQAEKLAESFLAQDVAGVFFAPMELIDGKEEANRGIVRMLERARIPLVLLDRDYVPYPDRSPHDLVGIDNRRAGHMITAHLLSLGVRNLVFVGEPNSANTVDARITGFHEALRSYGIKAEKDPVWRVSPLDTVAVRRLLDQSRPEGIVCGNDLTAGRLMQTLLDFGIGIPDEVRIVGIDDVKYASLLPVPLTTVHQDCVGIGSAAITAMLHRIQFPDSPILDLLVPTKLIVRKSCGAQLSGR